MQVRTFALVGISVILSVTIWPNSSAHPITPLVGKGGWGVLGGPGFGLLYEIVTSEDTYHVTYANSTHPSDLQ